MKFSVPYVQNYGSDWQFILHQGQEVSDGIILAGYNRKTMMGHYKASPFRYLRFRKEYLGRKSNIKLGWK